MGDELPIDELPELSDARTEDVGANRLLLDLQAVTNSLWEAEHADEPKPSEIARFKSVRSELFVPLMGRFAEPFRRYCQNRVGLSFDDADEVTQEAFVRILARIHQFDPERGRAEQWMFTIAHNLAVSSIRDKRETSASEEWFQEVEDFSEELLAQFVRDDESKKYVLSRIRCFVIAIEALSDSDRAALKKGPGERGPKKPQLEGAWSRLCLSLADCLVASEKLKRERN